MVCGEGELKVECRKRMICERMNKEATVDDGNVDV